MQLYFNDQAAGGGADGDYGNPANWWEDSAWTVPHNNLPNPCDPYDDDIEIDSIITQDTSGTMGDNSGCSHGSISFGSAGGEIVSGLPCPTPNNDGCVEWEDGDGNFCNPSMQDCAGVCYGSSAYDACGVCNGNYDCVDGCGVPYGNNEPDCTGADCGNCGSCDSNAICCDALGQDCGGNCDFWNWVADPNGVPCDPSAMIGGYCCGQGAPSGGSTSQALPAAIARLIKAPTIHGLIGIPDFISLP